MDFKMKSLSECKLHKIHIVLVLIWIYVAGVINADNYFTSNSEIFNSVPTTIKTNENDTVLLPCSPTGECLDMNITSFYDVFPHFTMVNKGLKWNIIFHSNPYFEDLIWFRKCYLVIIAYIIMDNVHWTYH